MKIKNTYKFNKNVIVLICQ